MGLILFPIFGAINAMIAKSKGYNAVLWFFAAGLLGLIVLVCLPNCNDEEPDDHEAERLRRRGNNIAGGIIAVGVGLSLLLILVAANM